MNNVEYEKVHIVNRLRSAKVIRVHLRRCTSYVSLPFPALAGIHGYSGEVDQDPLHILCFGGAEHRQAIIRYAVI